MKRIVIAEMMDPQGVSLLQTVGEVVYDPELWDRPESLVAQLSSAEALVVRNQTRVTSELLDEAKMLRVIGRLGVGLDNIDVAAAKRRHIEVVAAIGANAIAGAEFVRAYCFSQSLSNSTNCTCPSIAVQCVGNRTGSLAKTDSPRARARSASRCPMSPSPTIPSVLP